MIGHVEVKKALTFVAAQLMALGTFSALAVLIISSLSMYGFRNYIGYRAHNAAVVYSEVPVAFLCACFAQLLYRIRPVLVATVFVLLKTCVRVAFVPYVATSRHFWFESILSYCAALAGAAGVALILEKEGKGEPMHPGGAYALTATALFATWGVTWIVAARLR